MKTDSRTITQTLAVSAAALFLAACDKGGASTSPDDATAAAPDGGDDIEVHCFGINECKGQSACDVKDSHVCAGQNDCAGKGWIVVSKSECADKGGTEV